MRPLALLLPTLVAAAPLGAQPARPAEGAPAAEHVAFLLDEARRGFQGVRGALVFAHGSDSTWESTHAIRNAMIHELPAAAPRILRQRDGVSFVAEVMRGAVTVVSAQQWTAAARAAATGEGWVEHRRDVPGWVRATTWQECAGPREARRVVRVGERQRGGMSNATELVVALNPGTYDAGACPAPASGRAPASGPAPVAWSAAALRPTRVEYSIHVGAERLGSEVLTLSRAGDGWLSVDSVVSSQQTRITERRFGPDLSPAGFAERTRIPAASMEIVLRMENGRLLGQVERPQAAGGVREIDLPVPAGLHMPGAERWLLAASDFRGRDAVVVPLFHTGDREARTYVFLVEGTERVVVPAGEFDTFRVTAPSVRLWLRADAPHVIVRQEIDGGATILLESIR